MPSDSPEVICTLIEQYPEQFLDLYRKLSGICQNTEGVMNMFSEELAILDRNTVILMQEEMKKEIELQKAEIERILKALSARIAPEVAERVGKITSHIYDILHCNGIIRIDYIISPEGKINMLEVNTTPGMTATSFIPQQVRAAGLTMASVLTDIVENQFV